MKILILYATKYRAAREIAKRIADRISGAVVYDLKQSGVPNFVDYNIVIVGSSVYAGMIRKETKTFLTQNADILRSKRLGLFLSGLNTKDEKKYFNENIPKDILHAAKAASFLGGIFDPKKAGFMERIIMKAIAKHSIYTEAIDNDKIEKFVMEMST
jgi:menaquinone-dependent protoporphyrinogen oxidase